MKPLNILELAVVVAAQNHNPTVLNPDFLRYSGIVPADWTVGRPPVYTNQMAQILYQNGISLVAQPDRVMFIEALNDKQVQESEVANIAQKYTKVLSHAEYQAVGINVRGYVSFESAQAADEYLRGTLLAPGAWQNFGQNNVRPTLNLAYSLDESQLTVNIAEAVLQFPEQEAKPVVLFTGNFAYDLTAQAEAERLERLGTIIDRWQQDLATFENLVNQQFLKLDPASYSTVDVLLGAAA